MDLCQQSDIFALYIYLFIWLRQVLVVSHMIFTYGMWDLLPWPGIKSSTGNGES